MGIGRPRGFGRFWRLGRAHRKGGTRGLSRASDALAWSAQTRRGEPRPAERDGILVDFRGVAGVVAQAAIATDSAAGWALLISQMSRTVQAIRRAHEQRGEALQGSGWPPWCPAS